MAQHILTDDDLTAIKAMSSSVILASSKGKRLTMVAVPGDRLKYMVTTDDHPVFIGTDLILARDAYNRW